MKLIQRLSALIGWAGTAVIGSLMVAESTHSVSSRWRFSLSEILASAANPDMARWASAAIGGVLLLLAIAAATAQLVPGRRKVRAITIDKSPDGATIVGPPAIYSRLLAELSRVDGVARTRALPHHRRLRFRVDMADGSDLGQAASGMKAAITPEVWASLGLAPRRVEITLSHARSIGPSREERVH